MPVAAFAPSRIHTDYPEWTAPGIAYNGRVWAWNSTTGKYEPTAVVLSSSVSAFGATLIDDADAATARGTLGLGTMALATEANYPLLDGSRAMATAQRQAFTSGITIGSIRPASDSTSAISVTNAAGSFIEMRFDTTSHTVHVPGFFNCDSGYRLIGSLFMNRSGNWLNFFSASGIRIVSNSNSRPNVSLVNNDGAGTNTIANALIMHSPTTGSAGNGLGCALIAQIDSTVIQDSQAGRLTWEWVTATHASRASRGKLTAYYTSTEQTAMTWDGDTGGLKLAFYDGTPVAKAAAYTQTFATADRTLGAYTADNESGAYTGIDNAQGGTVYAQLTDLNNLRVAYENLRAFVEDLAQHHNSLLDDMQALNLVG